MDISAFMNRISNYKKKYTFAIAIILAGATIALAQDYTMGKLPILTVNTSKYTYSDVFDLKKFSAEVSRINGVSEAPQGLAVFQSLVVTAVEKEILKTPVNKEFATRMVMENNPYRGLLESSRKKMGEDKFYKLFVEPLAVGELFKQYYSNKDSQRQLANETLSVAKSVGMTAAAQKVGLAPQEIAFTRNQQNEPLYAALRQASNGNLVDRVVEDGDNFYVIQAVEITDQGARASAIVLPRTAPGEFLASEIKSKGINIGTAFYSIYRTADLAKPGMIFAAKPTETKDPKNEKK